MKSSINLKITNNVNAELPISILGVVPNPNELNNINTVYEFDMSGETLTALSWFFVYQDSMFPAISIEHFFNGITPTFQGYVDALNSLNVGFFTYNGNIIYMFSNNYIGDLIRII